MRILRTVLEPQLQAAVGVGFSRDIKKKKKKGERARKGDSLKASCLSSQPSYPFSLPTILIFLLTVADLAKN